MDELPPSPDFNNDADETGNGHGREASTPRWVQVFGTIALMLVLLFLILHLTGRGLGGHARHTNPTEQGVQKP